MLSLNFAMFLFLTIRNNFEMPWLVRYYDIAILRYYDITILRIKLGFFSIQLIRLFNKILINKYIFNKHLTAAFCTKLFSIMQLQENIQNALKLEL